MEKHKFMIWSVACLVLLSHCGPNATNTVANVNNQLDSGVLYWDTTKVTNDFTYDIEHPNAVFEMPNDLMEISGLTIDPTGKYLYCVQDEEGNIYKIDSETGEVVKDIPFGKDGDYEGIEKVGDRFFVIKSSGTVYEIDIEEGKETEVAKYNEGLSSSNDVEGLAFDAVNNRLLLACKESVGIDTVYEKQKAIYAFDLAAMKLDSTPVTLLRGADFYAYLKASPHVSKIEKLMKACSPEKASFMFSPSAIAVHPITGNWYVTSARKKILAVTSPRGQLLGLIKMDKKLLPQPEGIAFDQKGNMYISSEGKDGKSATIVKFLYNSK